jgi:hypothetical protein
MKLSTFLKLILGVAVLGFAVWLIISEIQFQQMRNEVQKTSWLRRMLT